MLQQPSAFGPFPGIFIAFACIAEHTGHDQIGDVIGGDITTRSADWKRMVGMMLPPLDRLSAIIALPFLPIVLFMYLLCSMFTWNSPFTCKMVETGYSMLLFAICFLRPSLLIQVLIFPFISFTAVSTLRIQSMLSKFKSMEIFQCGRKVFTACSTPPIPIRDIGRIVCLMSSMIIGSMAISAPGRQTPLGFTSSAKILRCSRKFLLAFCALSQRDIRRYTIHTVRVPFLSSRLGC